MAVPSKRAATYQDVLDAPEHLVAEIIDGDLYLTPRPAWAHARATSRLGMVLGGPFDLGSGGPGGWVIVDEPELHFVEHVVVPDLAGWRRERFPRPSDVPYLSVAPDWLCETLSPSTEVLDRTRKLRVYARAGVDHVWLVNARTRVLEVLRRADDRWLLIATFTDTARVRAEPFDALEFDLASLWSDVAPPPWGGAREAGLNTL